MRDRKSRTGKIGKPPQTTPPSGTQPEDVEQVMEHVSSPFRWEILDVPLNEQPKKDKRHGTKKQ